MNEYSLNEERRIIQTFVDFINNRVLNHMKKYGITDRRLCFPSIFHWGHAERTMFTNINKRNNNIWSEWMNAKFLLMNR